MNHTIYNQEFFATRDRETGYAAKTILGHALKILPPIHSAIDIGCGIGTWLNVLTTMGVDTIHGVDGPWVDPELLVIPEDQFECFDLQQIYSSSTRYDLAMSLEVAEHLPPDSAGSFVECLTRHADFVLFSAAVPNQGGQGHVNEQWQDYWAELFASHGYQSVDGIRSLIWNDQDIHFWYRQNILLYATRSRLQEISRHGTEMPRSIIHPELYQQKCNVIESNRASLAQPLSKRIVSKISRGLGLKK